ncbi:hypothetical protein P0158_27500 [Klebsiella pneumoniae]|jgi:hypothetical protein|nr:hypothetical protein [Klebsiella pneumoniae]MBK5755737.1 hypothetical protein [Klebsiella pneumoniae]MCB8851727.1 hypothetical protein [Klebsiella pneumoniae]MCB8871540.1 hypothetical protein [Klebsiella pneumoniae]QVR11457.1 hypothetical protein KI673_28180 [Klebsiella pneumoniae]QVW20926.1 hypothetical protein KI681_26795 [Klebsiella pneumoniae]
MKAVAIDGSVGSVSNEDVLIDTLSEQEQSAIFLFSMRGNWDFIRDFLKHHQLEKMMSNSRRSTYEKLSISFNELKNKNKAAFDLVFKEIKDYALSILTISNKAIYSLNLPKKELGTLLKNISSEPQDNALDIVDRTEDLSSKKNNSCWIDYENCKVCFFPTIKEANKKTSLDPKKHAGMEGFDSLYGFELVRNQYIDCLLLTKDKAFMLVDVIDDDSHEYCKQSYDLLLPKIKTEIIKHTHVANISTKDIFNSVGLLCVQDTDPYKKANYSVHEINFITPELSRYTAKKSPNKPDIRKDTFNKDGLKNNIQSLIFYKVSFNIDRSHPVIGFKYKVIVSIPGSYSRAAHGKGKVDYFLSTNFLNMSDFNIIEPLIL